MYVLFLNFTGNPIVRPAEYIHSGVSSSPGVGGGEPMPRIARARDARLAEARNSELGLGDPKQHLDEFVIILIIFKISQISYKYRHLLLVVTVGCVIRRYD